MRRIKIAGARRPSHQVADNDPHTADPDERIDDFAENRGRNPIVIIVVPKPSALWTQDPARMISITIRTEVICIRTSLERTMPKADECRQVKGAKPNIQNILYFDMFMNCILTSSH